LQHICHHITTGKITKKLPILPFAGPCNREFPDLSSREHGEVGQNVFQRSKYTILIRVVKVFLGDEG